MTGQTSYQWWAYSDEAYIYQATVQIKNRDTFAEAALGRVNFIDDGEDFWSEIGIIKMDSASGHENFNSSPRNAVYRHNVTSVTVQLTVISAFARGRLMLNYWS
jgi:hypothetical protein